MNPDSRLSLILKADSLGYRYKEGGGFSDFSLETSGGTVTALLGPNGCGKTTVLRVLSGLLAAQSGSVSISGEKLGDLKPRERARKIAMVAQRNEIPFAFTVRECVLMGRYAYGRPFRGPDDEDEDMVETLLGRWNLRALAERPVNLISGGELQKVLVLRALAQQSPLVLLDEPSNNLDPANQTVLASLIRNMAEEGRSVIVVLHDVNLANAVSDQAVLMQDGHVVMHGATSEVLDEKNLKETFDTTFVKVKRDDNSYTLVPRY